MRRVTPPGVFAPISDTWLLAAAMREQIVGPRATVLDVFTGSGALAIAAARRGARHVTAVDISRRAVLTARLNARLNGVRVEALRSDLFSAVSHRRFDVIVANPPYVPTPGEVDDPRGPRRAWDGGDDGRALLDRLLAEAPEHLRPGGILLVVHSEVCGIGRTLEAMAAGGLEADVCARRWGPLGPLMRARAPELERRGLLPPGARQEEIVVIRGRRPPSPAAPGARLQRSGAAAA